VLRVGLDKADAATQPHRSTSAKRRGRLDAAADDGSDEPEGEPAPVRLVIAQAVHQRGQRHGGDEGETDGAETVGSRLPAGDDEQQGTDGDAEYQQPQQQPLRRQKGDDGRTDADHDPGDGDRLHDRECLGLGPEREPGRADAEGLELIELKTTQIEQVGHRQMAAPHEDIGEADQCQRREQGPVATEQHPEQVRESLKGRLGEHPQPGTDGLVVL